MSWRDNIQDTSFVDLKTQPFTGKFIGGEEATNKWGNCIRLKFETKEGNTKTYDTNSKRLLGMMKHIPDGTVVKITRFGESTETTYDVDVIATKNSSGDIDYLKEIEKRHTEKVEEEWD